MYKNKLIIILMAYLVSFSSMASQELIKEFLTTNRDVLKLKTELKKSELSVDATLNKFMWVLAYSGSFYDSSLDSTSSLSQTGETIANSLSISKNFDWGGGLSF